MSAESSNRLEQSLHQRGRRMTRQRQAIYEVVMDAHDHLSAEEVYERVRQKLPQMSLATVYNSLEALVECGQIGKIPRTDDGPARYDWRLGPHHHARCIECGKIWDVEEDALDVRPKQHDHGFKTIGYKVEMIVACPQNCTVCRLKKTTTSPTPTPTAA